jgi:hypothetical protein
MTALAVAEVISVLGTIFSVISFAQSNLPIHPPQPTISALRIAVGLEGDAPGNVPAAFIYDEFGSFLGGTSPDKKQKIKKGGIYDLYIGQSISNAQATYVSINAEHDDGICIAYIGQTWTDGTSLGWLGDNGKQCDWDWYLSNVEVGPNLYKPLCMWIDSNHSNDLKATGFQIHTPDFFGSDSQQALIQADNYWYCHPENEPSFKVYTDTNLPRDVVAYNPPRTYSLTQPTSIPPSPPDPSINRRRSASNKTYSSTDEWSNSDQPASNQIVRRYSSPRSTNSTDTTQHKLITSSDVNHRASDLCNHEKSRGPDFVSLVEGKFCDMATKTLYPLCSDQFKVNCFNLDSNQFIPSGGLTARANALVSRFYSTRTDWI